MSAPVGNKFAAKAKVWSAAIERALERRSRVAQKDALDDLAEKLLVLCDEGDLAALKELGDRLEGKAAIAVALSGDPEKPIITRVERVIVRPSHTDS